MDDELSPEQLKALEQALLTLRDELRKDVEAATEAARPVELDQARVGRVSRIDAIQQQQMAAASRDANKERLAQVERALRRIADHEYGLCAKCEEPIPLARLEARPEAVLCVACAGRKRH